MICKRCGKNKDLAAGLCFHRASKAEELAVKRTVFQHIFSCLSNLISREWQYARFDIAWAWQRLWKIGDYAEGGTFDREGYKWRAEGKKLPQPEED